MAVEVEMAKVPDGMEDLLGPERWATGEGVAAIWNVVGGMAKTVAVLTA
jgi:hypothetical protein